MKEKTFIEWIKFLSDNPPKKQVTQIPVFKCSSCYSTHKKRSSMDYSICDECWYIRMAGCL